VAAWLTFLPLLQPETARVAAEIPATMTAYARRREDNATSKSYLIAPP
jgi:hypothetical protein